MFANTLQQEQTSFGLNTAFPLMRRKAHVSQALQLKPPSSPECCKCAALWPSVYSVTCTHIHMEQFSNMSLNGNPKYILRFHKSCGWRSCALPVPANWWQIGPVCAFITDWSPGHPSSWLKSSKHNEPPRNTLIKARATHTHVLLSFPNFSHLVIRP